MAYNRVSHGGGAVPTTLTSSIGAGDATFTLDASSGWPDGSVGPFYVVLGVGLATEEKVLVTARSGTSCTGVSRGADGTSASAHASGEAVIHVFSATEADEANQLVDQTLGAVTTKGDLLVATGASALIRLAAGVNDLLLVSDSATASGLKWAVLPTGALGTGVVTEAKLATDAVTAAKIAAGAVGASEIADGAVGTAEIATDAVTSDEIAANAVDTAELVDDAVTTAKIADSVWKYGTYSGTTDGSGIIEFAHGASFTPDAVLISATFTGSGANNARLFSKDATNLSVRYITDGGGNLSATAVSGSYLCFP
jgi:hypothetical protein